MFTYEKVFFIVGNLWGVAACVLLIIAWAAIYLDKDRHETLHRRVMIVMTVGGWAFVLLYLSGIYLRSTPMSVPRSTVPWIAAHGTVAVLTLCSATLLTWARLTRKEVETKRLRAHINERHTLYGRVIALLWFFSHAGGVVNLYLLA